MPDSSFDFSGDRFSETDVRAPNLQSAIAVATKLAMELIAADFADGRLDLNRRILIRNEAGKVVHVVWFRDIVGNTDAILS